MSQKLANLATNSSFIPRFGLFHLNGQSRKKPDLGVLGGLCAVNRTLSAANLTLRAANLTLRAAIRTLVQATRTLRAVRRSALSGLLRQR